MPGDVETESGDDRVPMARAHSGPPDRRAAYVEQLRGLATGFGGAAKWARLNFEDLVYRYHCCRTRDDLRVQFDEERLERLGGYAESYRDLLGQIVPGNDLRVEDLARVCGYNLVPQAARLVVEIIRDRLGGDLPPPLDAIRLSMIHPPKRYQLREFWEKRVLSAVQPISPQDSGKLDPDPWATVRTRAVACDVLADLLESSASPGPVPAGSALARQNGVNPTLVTHRPGKSPPPSAEKAYRLYEWAVSEDPGPPKQTDTAVYKWLKNNPKGTSDDLPGSAASFAALLRKARRYYGTSKHHYRRGRGGRSVREAKDL